MNPAFEPITFAEAMADQADLAGLCSDRQLVTNEIIRPNAWYGHDQILKAFAGWDPDRPLKIGIPHGVEYSGQPMCRKREAVPVFGYYTDEGAARCRQGGARHLWPIATPFWHLLSLQPPNPPNRAGTLFFPTHSFIAPDGGEFVEGLYDIPAIADRLCDLPDSYRPVTVCMYWLDVTLGKHLGYLERGLRVVSAGHRYDPQFLVRLQHLMSAHQVAMSNAIGSHVFYAIASGCRYEHLEAPYEFLGYDRRRVDAFERHAEIFKRQLRGGEASQRGLAERMLGARHMRPPAALAKLLGDAERLDRYGICRVAIDGGRQVIVNPPWAPLRAAHRTGLRLRPRSPQRNQSRQRNGRAR